MEIRDNTGKLLFNSESLDFDSADLSNADFSSLNLEGKKHFADACLVGANFSNTDLYWAYFYRSNCQRANFENACLRGAVFDEADLRGAHFSNADLSRDNLNGTTTMTGSDLRGADLSTANLTDTEMQGACFDSTTKFPAGFNPLQRGMKCEP